MAAGRLTSRALAARDRSRRMRAREPPAQSHSRVPSGRNHSLALSAPRRASLLHGPYLPQHAVTPCPIFQWFVANLPRSSRNISRHRHMGKHGNQIYLGVNVPRYGVITSSRFNSGTPLVFSGTHLGYFADFVAPGLV